MKAARRVHRGCALVVAAFVTVHVVNHLAALAGIAAHLRFMEAARLVYRQPFVEAVLLLCVTMQAGSGLWLAYAGRGRRSGFTAKLQAASGLYLALFLLIHVAAVLAGRALLDLDTNFHFAAAGLHAGAARYFFAPYYFLAVLAVFAHLGCALSRRVRRTGNARAAVLGVALSGGVVASSLILAAMLGVLSPYQVPQKYLDTFQAAPGGPFSSTVLPSGSVR